MMRHNDGLQFVGMGRIRKFWARDYALLGEQASPYAVADTGPNQVMFGGGSAMWEALMGRWTGYWDSGSWIAVGNSGAAGDQTDNALHGAIQMIHAMDADYPQHNDTMLSGALDIVFRSTFDTGEANFHWREWGLLNSTQTRLLNRKADDQGTKTADMVWEFTVRIRLAC